MTARKPVKKLRSLPRLVAVINSRADLDSAIRLPKPPDLFELRLDRLAGDLDAVENKVSKLRTPVIITARHPQEGGEIMGRRRFQGCHPHGHAGRTRATA